MAIDDPYMAALHLPRHQRSLAEIELDAAVASASHRCDALEERLDEFAVRIAAVRREATAAGIFEEPIPVKPAELPRRRPQPHVTGRTALARAAVR